MRGCPNCCTVDPDEFCTLSCDEIHRVLECNTFLNLGVCENEQPYIVPMSYRFKEREGALVFTLASPNFGKVLHCIENNQRVVLELNRKVNDGVKSVVIFGTAKIEREEDCCDCDHETKIIVTSESVTGRKYFYVT